MAQKIKELGITQQGGTVKITRNGETEWKLDCAWYVERIKEGKVSPERMANFIAEIIHDCINSKYATAGLTDLDELGQYSMSTYFSDLDYRA